MAPFTDALSVLKQDYQIEEIVARTDDATIFRVVPFGPERVVTDGETPAIASDWSDADNFNESGPVRAGRTVFLGIVHYHIPENALSRPSHWQVAKRLIRQTARQIDPALAEFPEWNRVYADDPYFLDEGIAAGLHWATFQITSYKRHIHRVASQARAPQNFRQSQRRRLLARANHLCQRCGSGGDIEVDHIIPVTHGGTNDDANALVLCKQCHLEKTRAERKILGLSGDWIEHNEPPERHAAITPLTASPSVFLAELERRTGFTVIEVQNE